MLSMAIPLELIVTVLLSALGGALIPAIGLWLQSRQSKRELSLRHEEVLYRRRLELALEISTTCYNYMAVNHKLKNEKDEQLGKAYLPERVQLGKEIQAHESQVRILFPPRSVAAFRKYWRAVDEIGTSRDIHWTVVGSLLDEAYFDLTGSMRSDLGIESVEKRLIQTFGQGT